MTNLNEKLKILHRDMTSEIARGTKMTENAPVSNGKKITDLKDFSRLTSNGNSKPSKKDTNGEHQPGTDCSSPDHIR